MGNFNRGGNRSGDRGFGRRDFNDRGSRGPAQMHQTVCDKCRKDCEVPFRPTSGKPVYCSSCFDRPTSGRPEGRNFERPNFPDRRMFDAVCDECKKNCQVPFQPREDKPIYCSDCFGTKGGRADSRNTETSYSKHEEQFALLNSKLDQVLNILMPVVAEVEAEEALVEEVKKPKKSPSKKK